MSMQFQSNRRKENWGLCWLFFLHKLQKWINKKIHHSATWDVLCKSHRGTALQNNILEEIREKEGFYLTVCLSRFSPYSKFVLREVILQSFLPLTTHTSKLSKFLAASKEVRSHVISESAGRNLKFQEWGWWTVRYTPHGPSWDQ